MVCFVEVYLEVMLWWWWCGVFHDEEHLEAKVGLWLLPSFLQLLVVVCFGSISMEMKVVFCLFLFIMWWWWCGAVFFYLLQFMDYLISVDGECFTSLTVSMSPLPLQKAHAAKYGVKSPECKFLIS